MDGDDLEDADEDDDDDDEGATGQFRYQIKSDPQYLNNHFLSTVQYILHKCHQSYPSSSQRTILSLPPASSTITTFSAFHLAFNQSVGVVGTAAGGFASAPGAPGATGKEPECKQN